MRKYLIRFTVILLTAAVGLAATGISKSLRRFAHRSRGNAQVVHLAPPSVPQHPEHPQQLMPKSLSPYDIETFINENPQANLSQLWQSLGVPTKAQRSNWDWYHCENCRAESSEFDLDGESGNEVLLRVAVGEAYRYLVFKLDNDREERWRLLGYIDAWGKYQEASHMVLLSDGKPWLLIRDQGASGSGVALYIDRLFQVTSRDLRELVAYSSEGHQVGYSHEPTRDFLGRISSCEIHDERATITIDYSVTYLMVSWDQLHYIPLLRKQQRAVLVGSLGRKGTMLDLNRSSVSRAELEAVYNIDSLSNEDFLKYNYRELLQIAAGTQVAKKEWLRQYLKECEDSIEHRRLVGILDQ